MISHIKYSFLLILLVCILNNVFGQTLIDDFTRANNTTVGNGWTEVETVVSGAQIVSNSLQVGSTTAGRDWVWNDATSYFTTNGITNNTSSLVWAFNMKNGRASPSGFDAGNYGIAFVLGSTSNDYTLGNGYAIALGNSSTPDPIRLIRFTGGMDLNSNTTTIISGGDYQTANTYFSIKVVYDPTTDNWSLYCESNGSAYPQSNPLLTSTQIGATTLNTTYTATGNDIKYYGCIWNHSTSAIFSNFDDVYIPSFACSAPSTQAYNITFSSVDYLSMNVSWTNGNGSKRVVKMNTSNSFTAPANGTDPAANPVYGGSGEQVVYNNNSNSVSISGLNPGTSYWFRVYEYNCIATNTVYLTSTATNNPNSQATLSCLAPTIQSHTITFSSVSSSSMQVDWTIGNGSKRIVIMNTSNSFTNPTNGTDPASNTVYGGSGEQVVFNGTGSSVTVSGLTASTTYWFRVYEYNCTGTNTVYYTPTASDNPKSQATVVGGCATDLIISEYVEGSSNNKYIEIFNGTGSTVDLTDYQLINFANGSPTPSNTHSLTGTLTDNSTIVYMNSAAIIYGGSSTVSNAVVFNGDDAVALKKISTGFYVDIIGCIGEDPGTAWTSGSHSTLDKTLVRKSSVTSGITSNPASGFPTLVSEWDLYNIDDVSHLGSHIMSCICNTPTIQAHTITFPSIYSTQLTASWTNGDGSKRIVIINTSNSFTNPIDGVDPVANSAYGGSGEQVVYNGNGNAVTVSGLSASTTYWFRVYEANCYSTSIVFYTPTASDNPNSCSTNTTAPPAVPTTFYPGDIIIIGFDTNIGNGGWDIITIASFVDIGPGTSIILANMVYEYEDAANVSTGRWYRCSSDAGKSQSGHPQYLEITYNGSSALPAGTVICITLNSNDDCLQDIQINGVSSSDFSDNASGQVNMSSSDPDAIFLMQGAFTGILTVGSSYNYRTFTGSVLGGIQSRGDFQPITVPGNNGGERVSRIHPDLECLKLNTGVATGEFYMYYYDWELHIGSQHALLNNIFDMTGTWDSGAGTTTANEVPICGVTFTITSSAMHGNWTGESNVDWFNCANWESFSVPDSLTDVTVHSDDPIRDCVIDITTYSATASRFGNLAQCRNLLLEGPVTDNKKLTIQADPANKLEIFEDLTITGNGMLDMTDGNGGTADGTIDLRGNWDNQVGPARFDEGNSTINFIGTVQQEIDCNGSEEVFFDVETDNIAGILLNDNIQISGNLTLTNGVITTGSDHVYISNNNAGAIATYSQSGFVYGNLRRNFALNTNTYPFPVGNGTTTSNYKRMDFINNNLNLSTGTDYLDVSVSSITESGLNDDPELVATEDGTPIVELLESAIWTVLPSGTISSGTWGTNLYVQNVTGLSSADDNTFSVMKRPTGSADYADWDSFDAITAIPTPGAAGRIYDSGNGYAQKTGFNSFSELAIGKGNFLLPVELILFDAKYNGKTVDIEWTTASEINNDYFEIERSKDAVKFYAIDKVEGYGNSNITINYFTEDDSPMFGLNYYRLKQIDIDGDYAYSNTVAVNISNNNSEFFFDGENGKIYISQFNGSGIVSLKISDIQGRTIYEKNIGSDENVIAIDFDKNLLGKGIYIISIISNDSVKSKRIFID
ncbi:MAG: lamin tail domain-containing protein [Bacteroidota bacterium]